MEPGTYISIAQIAFQGACYAVKTFRKGLNYNKDAERLVLGLEVERFRLQIWGENAGLAPKDGQLATLPGRLLPLCKVLKEYLDQIERLVKDADGLSDRYGLLPTEEPATGSELVRRLVDKMQRSIRTSGIKLESGEKDPSADDDAEDDEASIPNPEKRKTTSWKRVRWAVRDLDKFDALVKDLAQRISKLNELMTEAQQRKTQEDYCRVNMIVVGSAVDEASLELIRAAVRGEPDTSQVRAAVERKALSVADPENTSLAVAGGRPRPSHVAMALPPLALQDFNLPGGFADRTRFLTTKISDTAVSSTYYLLERKPYDPNISPQDKARLTSRIQRLVMLLRKPKSTDFMTPTAETCIDDPAHSCWWMVLRFPLSIPTGFTSLKPNTAPVSLLTLLNTPKFRPPLEQRLSLARSLCTTLSELYSSSWLHKGVRSDNILFPHAGVSSHNILKPLDPPVLQIPAPYTPSQTQQILSSSLVCGFEYSRHESEWATIDRARSAEGKEFVATAMYRHPDYQGEAAQGYRVQYDVYSVGLVLVEIALWMPLGSFLDGKPSRSGTGIGIATGVKGLALGERRAESVILSGDMETFHAPHAGELRKRVLARVENEMAFRVGSRYAEVVKFCLGFADRLEGGEGTRSGGVEGGEVGLHPAMKFYDHVVVPLAQGGDMGFD